MCSGLRALRYAHETLRAPTHARFTYSHFTLGLYRAPRSRETEQHAASIAANRRPANRWVRVCTMRPDTVRARFT